MTSLETSPNSEQPRLSTDSHIAIGNKSFAFAKSILLRSFPLQGQLIEENIKGDIGYNSGLLRVIEEDRLLRAITVSDDSTVPLFRFITPSALFCFGPFTLFFCIPELLPHGRPSVIMMCK
jgi:hypothetical protein